MIGFPFRFYLQKGSRMYRLLLQVATFGTFDSFRRINDHKLLIVLFKRYLLLTHEYPH